MARGSNRNISGDVVLESRHLIGLFVMMVVIFGVVFVLGYELGRNQVTGQVRASEATEENASGAPGGGSAIVPPAVSGPVIQPSAAPKTPATNTKNGNAKNNSVQPPAANPAANNSAKAGAKPPSAPSAKTV